ncbi:MAG TPA: hypothetical protein DCQ31_05330 [Bacteroidales bacterium]|nr:hypothetical protein [Bacteroidales bacterium]
MNTYTLHIDFPADLFLALNKTEHELVVDIKVSLAIRLYTSEKLTLGKAAQLVGLSHYEFETLLAETGIPISNLSINDVINDSEKLK